MKKFLLAVSIVCFAVTIVMGWLCSFWTGLLMTLILGALITFGVYLIKNTPRLWISIAMFILALLLLFWVSVGIGCRMARNSTFNTQIDSEEKTEILMDEEENKEIVENEIDVQRDETVEDDTNTIVKEVVKEVPVEKVIVKEVPKIVEKEVIKEVPKIEYIEVEKEPEVTYETTTPTITTPNPNPNTNNVNYGGPTTVYGYGYGYGYDYPNEYGYPGYAYNYSNSIKIKGETEVLAGSYETYTISGVNSISKNKLELPENVSYDDHSGNKVTLYFDEDWTGGYCVIKYGSAKLKIDVIPCD